MLLGRYVMTPCDDVLNWLLHLFFLRWMISRQIPAAHSTLNYLHFFKVAAAWGGHEGFNVVWLSSLSLWLKLLLLFFNRKNDPHFFRSMLSLLGIGCFGLRSLFYFIQSIWTLFPAPAECCPISINVARCQLIFHPPLLYVGYNGLCGEFCNEFECVDLQTNRTTNCPLNAWMGVGFLVVLAIGIVAWCLVGILRTWLGRLGGSGIP